MAGNFGAIIVAVDENGKVRAWKIINRDEWPDPSEYYKGIANVRRKLLEQYPEPQYYIYEGVADSLATFLRSYPEVTYPKVGV